jgi:hypothetical protein
LIAAAIRRSRAGRGPGWRVRLTRRSPEFVLSIFVGPATDLLRRKTLPEPGVPSLFDALGDPDLRLEDPPLVSRETVRRRSTPAKFLVQIDDPLLILVPRPGVLGDERVVGLPRAPADAGAGLHEFGFALLVEGAEPGREVVRRERRRGQEEQDRKKRSHSGPFG